MSQDSPEVPQGRLLRELREMRAIVEELQQLEMVRRHAFAQGVDLYRVLVDNSLSPMCSHDQSGVLLAVNPAAAQLLGYAAEEIVGRRLDEFLTPETKSEMGPYLERIASAAVDRGVMRLQTRTGGERVWIYRNVRYDDPDGEVRVLGHADDITDRIEAERGQRDAERRFRRLADSAPVLMWVSDAAGDRTFVNLRWMQFTGCSREESLGPGWRDYVHPDDTRGLAGAQFQARTDLGEYRTVYRLRHTDGGYRLVLEIGAAYQEEDGQFAGFAGTCLELEHLPQENSTREALRRAVAILAAVQCADETSRALLANVIELLQATL